MRDNIIFTLRIIGGIGTLLLAWEILRIFRIVKHPRLRRMAYNIFLFFGIYGCLKLIATAIDTWLSGVGIAGAFVNNLLVYWLVGFMYRRRKRIEIIDKDTEARNRLTASINEILDEMYVQRDKIRVVLT